MITIVLKSLLGGLFVSFLLASIFIIPLGGIPRVEAAIGTGCGDASGKNASVAGNVLTDPSKNWRPSVSPGRWASGVLTITGSPTVADIGKKGTVLSSTGSTITVILWTSTAPTSTTGFSYTVTAKPTACKEGNVDYSCVQAGDAGFCKGPCSADSACDVFLVGGTSDIGFGGTRCTSTDPLNPGSCLELPRSTSRLPDAAPATTGEGLLLIVDTVTNWIFAVFVLLSIIFVLLAAFQFVTAGGEATKVGEARSKLIWAAVGIIIALLAKGIVPIVRNIIGG